MNEIKSRIAFSCVINYQSAVAIKIFLFTFIFLGLLEFFPARYVHTRRAFLALQNVSSVNWRDAKLSSSRDSRLEAAVMPCNYALYAKPEAGKFAPTNSPTGATLV